VAVIGPLGSLDPVVTVVAAAFLLHERLDRRRLVGVIVCVSGILLVAL
jgi:drug/metabolite transporter (DMT)-like permease